MLRHDLDPVDNHHQSYAMGRYTIYRMIEYCNIVFMRSAELVNNFISIIIVDI
jgi:hypothetical protein